ncbi:MAG: DUF4836 family protein [Bacteroidetes bacterium]|nr:DUF4836 family protein [Bacteroidota bacterium]
MKTLLYLSLTLAACRLSAQSLIRHLPPDACAIYHFNLPVLRTRMPLSQLTERIPLPQANTYNRELAAILREPGRAGVDTTQDLFLTEVNGRGRDSLHTTSLLVHLSDSARWSAFLRELSPGLRVAVGGGSAGQDRMASSWDSGVAVLTYVRKVARNISPAGVTSRAMKQTQLLLRGWPDSTAIRDPLFLAGFADDADIHAWTDQGKLLFLLTGQLLHLDHTPSYPSLTPPECGKVHTLSSLRFEKGRILLKNTLCLPPGVDSLYARLTARPLPESLLSQIPSGDLLGLVSIHFDPASVASFLDGLQARGRSEALLFDRGVSLETFVRSFTGDFLLTAIQPVSDSTPVKPSLYLAATLRDLSAFWSWSSHLKWLNPTSDPTGAGRVSNRNPISKKLPAYILKDSTVVISSSAKKAAAWFAPVVSNDTAVHISYLGPAFPPRGDTTRFRNCPISAWFDLKALTASLQKRPEKNRGLLALMSSLDLLTFTAGYLNSSGQLENVTELRLTDTEENSLKTMFKILQ